MKMKCDCGFEFAGPGEFRNCNVIFVQFTGEKYPVWVSICPKCGTKWRNDKQRKTLVS